MYKSLCIVSVVCLLYFLLLKVDNTKYYEYIAKYNLYAKNESLSKLLNADPLGNLPHLFINSTNVEVEKSKNCFTEPVYLNKIDDDVDHNKLIAKCHDFCGSNSDVVRITDTDEYYQNSKKLQPGYYCMVATEQTKCNLNTGYVVASGLGGVVCTSKFPNMFGGSDASTIVACNDERYPANGGVLWDNYYNVAVNPATVTMTNEDEVLSDGSYRFTCRYNDDYQKNLLLEHPVNRFHPIRNPCTKRIYAAHRSVGVKKTTTNWSCDCGDPLVTRLRNKDPDNPKSECSSCVNSIEKNNYTYKIKHSYDCFTLNSNVEDLVNLVPCNNDAFVNLSTTCDVIEFKVSEKRDPVPGLVYELKNYINL